MAKSPLYNKSAQQPAEKATNRPSPKAEASSETSHVADVSSRHETERKTMHKSHETERRDMHGSHREDHRKMAERHDKAHTDLDARQDAEMQAAMAQGAGGDSCGGCGRRPAGRHGAGWRTRSSRHAGWRAGAGHGRRLRHPPRRVARRSRLKELRCAF